MRTDLFFTKLNLLHMALHFFVLFLDFMGNDESST